MPPTTRLDEARIALAESVTKMEEWDTKSQSLPEDADPKETEFVRDAFDHAQRENQRWQDTVDRLRAIESAQAESAKRTSEDEEEASDTEQRHFAGANGVKREEKTYTERTARQGVSFFVDLVNSLRGDGEARERLDRHSREIAMEQRDLTTTVTAGGNFVPPQYLGELFAGMPRPGREFADAVPNRPLMATGMTITIPRITTGTTEASQATENTAVSETDIVEALLSVPVRTIAGQQDVSQQLFDRSEPGIDQILFADLRSAYDAQLDNQLINGAGTLGTHTGVRTVASPNTVTFTTGSPTAALTVPKIYDASQLIWSNRFAAPDLILMHPRRSAYLASSLSSTFPLFQIGSLTQASGTQSPPDLPALVPNMAGLKVVNDANVRTTDGASTNQDEVYVLRVSDFILWEGPLQARVLSDVGSGTLTVRLQLFAYSAFTAGRYPKSISIISGTGLTAPTF
jgi:HK97 family phage major capsid protein